jgi:ATP-dependent Clp protease protease subunit
MGRGTASDLRITAEQIVRLRERYNRIVSEATGKPAEQVHEAVQRDFWLSAPEANEYGLVDRIIENHSQI